MLRSGEKVFEGSVAELRNAFADKPVGVYLRTSIKADGVLKGTGLEFAKRGCRDYVVRLPNLGHLPRLI